MLPGSKNYAFIDGANLRISADSLGISIDYTRLQRYLETKYSVLRVYFFDGDLVHVASLHAELKRHGYEVVLRHPVPTEHGVKANCDTEMVLRAMIEWDNYDQAVIITNDGDFGCLIRHLKDEGKLRQVIGCNPRRCSTELRSAAGAKFAYLEQVRSRIECQETR